MVDHRRRANDPGVHAARVAPFLGAEDTRLLLRFADEEHALLAGKRGEVCLRDVILPLPLSKVTRSTCAISTNRSIAVTNRSVIGAIITVDGTRTPSCVFTK
jgi:hypothetical protein